jgi:membrane fusion protein (multidrug efflux system)
MQHMRGLLFQYKLYVLIFFSAVLTLGLEACSKEAPPSHRRPAKVHLVEAAPVQRVDSGVTRVRTGTLRARREINIYSQEEGRVTALPFYEGDKVRKGQVVARLDDELLRSQLERAQATLRKANEDLKRIRGLYKKKLTTDEEMSRIETEQEVAKADVELLTTRLGYTVIKAPIHGVISQRLTEPGNVVEKHTHLLTISDPSSLVTEVSLSELILPQVAVDDPVKVTIDALGRAVHNGKILRIHPTLDPVTRRGTVEVEIKPVPNGARPGQLCRVEFTTRIAQRLVIPFRAIRRDDQGEYVFVLEKTRGKASNDVAVNGAKQLAKNSNNKDSVDPGADGSLSHADGSSPKADGSLSDADGSLPKADGSLPKADDSSPKADGSLRVAKRVAIHSGLRIGEHVEILKGLEEHQQVVTRGFLDLNNGKEVKIVNSPDQGGATQSAVSATASANGPSNR